MKTRLLSALLVFLLVASVSVPAVSAGNPVDDEMKAFGDGIKGAIDFTKEALKEIKEVNKMARESPEMQKIYDRGAVGAASGGASGAAVGGPDGILAGAVIGGIAGIAEGCSERVIDGNDA